MLQRTMKKSNGAKNGCATRRSRRGTDNKRGLETLEEELVRVVRVDLRERSRQGNARSADGSVAKSKKVVRTVALCRSSKETPESRLVVGMSVSRKGSAPLLERTKSAIVGTEAFVDWQKESSERSKMGESAERRRLESGGDAE